jgi:hypothetical protein
MLHRRIDRRQLPGLGFVQLVDQNQHSDAQVASRFSHDLKQFRQIVGEAARIRDSADWIDLHAQRHHPGRVGFQAERLEYPQHPA